MPTAMDNTDVTQGPHKTNNRNRRRGRAAKRTPFPDLRELQATAQPRHLHTQEWLAQLN